MPHKYRWMNLQHGTGATFIDGAFKDTKNFRELSEWDLEDYNGPIRKFNS